MQIKSINPYDGQINGEYESTNQEELLRRIKSTHLAFKQWKNTSFEKRATMLVAVASELEKIKSNMQRPSPAKWASL